jgi:hypothetical protein
MFRLMSQIPVCDLEVQRFTLAIVDHTRNIEDVFGDGGPLGVAPYLTTQHFPHRRRGIEKNVPFAIVSVAPRVKSREVERAMAQSHFRHADADDMAAFSGLFPDEQRKGSISFLGVSWFGGPLGLRRYVGYLSGDTGYRHVDFYEAEAWDPWSPLRFAVRTRK